MLWSAMVYRSAIPNRFITIVVAFSRKFEVDDSKTTLTTQRTHMIFIYSNRFEFVLAAFYDKTYIKNENLKVNKLSDMTTDIEKIRNEKCNHLLGVSKDDDLTAIFCYKTLEPEFNGPSRGARTAR
ncbi:hypothetical protein NECAME_06765 [Necator americanus]|uniref:Uncharacterized protein n=1 Tax=Necator americanus TaxID=51031 RepID=W2TU96_NECAM|nr:hypothetical protein NECAME_06765 [Necator americanus]ETN84666.1 hypothetical protein NECAME_06765 [Necator americanus]